MDRSGIMHLFNFLCIATYFAMGDTAYDTFLLKYNSHAVFDSRVLEKAILSSSNSSVSNTNEALEIESISAQFTLKESADGLLFSVIKLKNKRPESWFALNLKNNQMKLLLGKNGGETLTIPLIGKSNSEEMPQKVSITRVNNAITLEFNKGRPLTFHISEEHVDTFTINQNTLLTLGRPLRFKSIFPQMETLSSCINRLSINGNDASISPESASFLKLVDRCQLSSATQCRYKSCEKNEVCFKTIGCDGALDFAHIQCSNGKDTINTNAYKKVGVKLKKLANPKILPWILMDLGKVKAFHGASITVISKANQDPGFTNFYLEFGQSDSENEFYPYTENGILKIFSTMIHLNTTLVYLSWPVLVKRVKVYFVEYNPKQKLIFNAIGCEYIEEVADSINLLPGWSILAEINLSNFTARFKQYGEILNEKLQCNEYDSPTGSTYKNRLLDYWEYMTYDIIILETWAPKSNAYKQRQYQKIEQWKMKKSRNCKLPRTKLQFMQTLRKQDILGELKNSKIKQSVDDTLCNFVRTIGDKREIRGNELLRMKMYKSPNIFDRFVKYDKQQIVPCDDDTVKTVITSEECANLCLSKQGCKSFGFSIIEKLKSGSDGSSYSKNFRCVLSSRRKFASSENGTSYLLPDYIADGYMEIKKKFSLLNSGSQCAKRTVYNMSPGFQNTLKDEVHFEIFGIHNTSIFCRPRETKGYINIKFIKMSLRNREHTVASVESTIISKVKRSCEGNTNCTVRFATGKQPLNQLSKDTIIAILYECIYPLKKITEDTTTAPELGTSIYGKVSATTMSYNDTINDDIKSPEAPANLVYYISCPSTTTRNIHWPDSPIGLIPQRCPRGSYGTAYWWCEPGGWSKQRPDLSKCFSLLTQKFEDKLDSIGKQENRTQYELLSLAEMQSEILQDNSTPLFGGDWLISTTLVNRIMDLAENSISSDKKVTRAIADAVGDTVDSLLNQRNEEAWQDITEDEKATRAVDLSLAMEKSVFLAAAQSNISGNTISTRKSTVVQMTSIRSASNDGSIDTTRVDFPYTTPDKTATSLQRAGSISLPHNAKFGIDTDVVFVLYENLDKLLGNNFIENVEANEQADAVTVPEYPSLDASNASGHITSIISKVISATVRPSNTDLYAKEKVRIMLNHHKPVNQSKHYNIRCVYWKTDSKNGGGYWSPNGCRLISTSQDSTECECNHLTSFAILMDTVGTELSEENELALSLLTYIGCSMSVVCLLLSAISFTILPGLKSVRTSIHRCLCVSLALAQTVFLVGVDHTQNKVACSIIAGLLHYLFLVVFGWMCVEGYHLYISLIKVFSIDSSSRMAMYCSIVHLVPLVIVGVSAAIRSDGYGTDKHCWLSTDDNFMWAFAGPVLLVALINTYFLIVAMRLVSQHNVADNTRLEAGRKLIKGSAAILSLLGITWILGIFFVNNASAVFAYAFTICNAFEGVFIFVFHCFFNNKVRNEWRKLILRSSLCPAKFKRSNQSFLTISSTRKGTTSINSTVVLQNNSAVTLTYVNTLVTSEGDAPSQHNESMSSAKPVIDQPNLPEWRNKQFILTPEDLMKTGIKLTTDIPLNFNNTNNNNNKISNPVTSQLSNYESNRTASRVKCDEESASSPENPVARPWKCQYSRSLYSKRPSDPALSARHRPLRATLSQASISSSVLGHETRYNSFMHSAKNLQLTRHNTSMNLTSCNSEKKNPITSKNLSRTEDKGDNPNADCPSGLKGKASRRFASLLLNTAIKTKSNEISTKL
uniref:uncharacterized protein LOC120337897 n=1 Tax=Styela clava TaxID=7725 RepID=UPI00193A70A0|nr:uncharacterized protein LOC120337897 [Styela clava]